MNEKAASGRLFYCAASVILTALAKRDPALIEAEGKEESLPCFGLSKCPKF
jgi:hypothetical protein